MSSRRRLEGRKGVGGDQKAGPSPPSDPSLASVSLSTMSVGPQKAEFESHRPLCPGPWVWLMADKTKCLTNRDVIEGVLVVSKRPHYVE